jgi:hypothetical protein
MLPYGTVFGHLKENKRLSMRYDKLDTVSSNKPFPELDTP